MRVCYAYASMGVLGLSMVTLVGGCSPQPSTTPTTTEGHPTSTAPPTASDPASSWKVSKDVSELDHKKRVALSSSNVFLRCAPRFEAYIVPYIPSLGNRLEAEDGRRQTVRYRIDDSPIHRQSWAISDDFTALFLPNQTVRAALKGKKLVVEFKPDYVSPDTQTFGFDGLETAARREGCKL